LSRRPHPNTPHWQRIVATFREIAGRSWRTTAATHLGIRRSYLRGIYDHNLPPEMVESLDRELVEALKQHIRDLDRRRAMATSLIIEIQHASYERAMAMAEAATVDEHMPGTLDARPMIDWFFRQLSGDPMELAA
jgi:hypothetical protein